MEKPGWNITLNIKSIYFVVPYNCFFLILLKKKKGHFASKKNSEQQLNISMNFQAIRMAKPGQMSRTWGPWSAWGGLLQVDWIWGFCETRVEGKHDTSRNTAKTPREWSEVHLTIKSATWAPWSIKKLTKYNLGSPLIEQSGRIFRCN